MNLQYQSATGLVASVKTLLTLPEVYLRVKAVVDDPESCLSDLVAAISIDPGITARLLRMVNSAYFNLGVTVDNVPQAVSLLGMKAVHNLVLATTLSHSFSKKSSGGVNMRQFWEDSVKCAVYARAIAIYCSESESERLFVDGLLSNIGHQVMYMQMSEQTLQASQQSHTLETPLAEVEKQLFGFDYTDVGGELLQQWKMPQSISDVVRFQNTPEKAGNFVKDAAIVHMANVLPRFTDSRFDNEILISTISSSAWEATGLDPENLHEIHQDSSVEIAETILMLIGLDKAA